MDKRGPTPGLQSERETNCVLDCFQLRRTESAERLPAKQSLGHRRDLVALGPTPHLQTAFSSGQLHTSGEAWLGYARQRYYTHVEGGLAQPVRCQDDSRPRFRLTGKRNQIDLAASSLHVLEFAGSSSASLLAPVPLQGTERQKTPWPSVEGHPPDHAGVIAQQRLR